MPSSSPQRKYALTKIKAGDYLLPSNDGKTIWRLSQYEDGPSHGLEHWPRDRMLWGLWRWTGPVRPDVAVDVEDWDRWAMVGDNGESRADVIAMAMRLEGAS